MLRRLLLALAFALIAPAFPSSGQGVGVLPLPALPEAQDSPAPRTALHDPFCPVEFPDVAPRRMDGPPPIVEVGVSTLCVPAWGKRGFEYWAARLHRAGRAPALVELFDLAWMDEVSPLLSEPIAGALVLYLVNRWGREGLAGRLAAWRPDRGELESMEGEWMAFLDALLRSHRGVIEDDLSHAAARRSDASLERLAALGANGVAILPYAFLSDPDRPAPIRPPTRPGSETDGAVVHAVRTAQSLGLTVLLKPHIWVRDSWPGEVRMASRADWDRFFEYYERWILHYALIAEIHDIPLLSVGVELSAATLGREDRWVELVQRVRAVYSGAVVYSANWGEEFEGLGFWNAFNYIGVDAYYPLSPNPEASDRELREGAEAMLGRIETVHRRYGVPVLLTEVGFASTRAAWTRPWEGHRIQELSLRDQFRSYLAVLEALEGRAWVRGVFWWKWPSDPRRVERSPRGFKPLGKPVEALLTGWVRGDPASAWPRWSEVSSDRSK